MNADSKEKKMDRELVGKIVHQGPLLKLPVGRQSSRMSVAWKERHVVLAENLAYYESQERFNMRQKPKGVINLDFVSVEDRANPSEFMLQTAEKMVVFRADSVEEAMLWKEMLKRRILVGEIAEEEEEE